MKSFSPCGFLQPPQSFRFSIDALLLQAFSDSFSRQGALLDLGTGCGVIAINALRRHKKLQALGVDFQEELLLVARANAVQFCVAKRFQTLCLDLDFWGKTEESRNLRGAFSVILANPPYRLEGTGRLPKDQMRYKALFGKANTLHAFVCAAQFSLQEEGVFCLIFPAKELVRLLQALDSCKFFVQRILPVQSYKHSSAEFILVEARKKRRGSLELSPPLVLYARKSQERNFTTEAFVFCPWLRSKEK